MIPKRKTIVRFRNLLMVSCLGFSTGVLAQTAPASAGDDTTVKQAADEPAADIVVTGSRIRRAAADSPSPLAVVSSDEIKAAGTQNIADIVNQLPALAVTQTNQTSNLAGNPGINALDLRGMGTQRTLVLVDGRRQVPAIPGTSAVDLSNIPSSLVERVEIITGGASALYGADAVAGVANFILKKDYEGIEANTRYSASTRGDMDTYGFDLLAGTNFADRRGNVTVYGFFENVPGTVSGQDRPWTADGYPIYTRSSSSSPYYVQDHVRNIYTAKAAQVVLGGKLYSVNSDGTLRDPILGPGGFVNATPVDLDTATDPLGTLLTDGGEYNGRYDGWYLSVPSERINTRASASFEVSSALKLFANATFAHNKSQAGYLQMTSFGTDVVPADSPFITDEMIAANGGSIPDGGLQFARQFSELPAPRTDYDRTLFQAVAGAEGDFTLFSQPWNYSAYYSYGKTTERVRDVNATAYDRWYLGLDSTTGADGQPVCRSTLDDPGNGCVAINPFVPLTQDMIDYITYTSHWSKSTMTQQVLSGYVSGGLFNLPGGALQVVLGGEYRKERNDIGAIPEYDPNSPLFDASIGTVSSTLVGRYSVKEVYGEVHAPLLAHRPFFDTLSLDGAVRLSDYSTAGSTTTWKLGGEWAPIPDLRFRATYGQAVRAPNIGELYTANSIYGQWITDPCNDWNLANRSTRTEYTAANCAAINPADTASYWLWRDIISSGNVDLKPETAKTLTLGAVLQPRFIPGFSFTVDYYNIDLRNAIDSFNAQTLINKCVDQPSLDNDFCDLIERDANGNLESVKTQDLNLAQYLTRGVDFGLNYSLPLSRLGMSEDAGTLSIDANYTRLIKRRYTLDPTDPNTITEYAGVFGSPKWKGVVRTTYTNESKGFGVTWSLRHVSPMKASSTITSEDYSQVWTPNVFYNDFSAYVALTKNIELSGGLNNAFDRAPPRIPGAEAGGANFELSYQSGVYDVIGRTFFLSVRFHR